VVKHPDILGHSNMGVTYSHKPGSLTVRYGVSYKMVTCDAWVLVMG